eukprot:c17883_g1_i2 orf=244-2673(+)
MKGRARPPSSPESEESWTVDCPCGVNFDDGEEMVDCDECGVWVHTGCCHILKGHTSYVCDKCKFKKKKESEESEVAQLLVELPSKTPPLEEKVFTLRTELSREERAHVQGIPGGDPNFFAGVSPVFSRQLWKHTGYVPKLFQFNYNELPEEKAGACILFGDYAEKSSESPAVECTKSDHQIEEGKSLDTDMQPLGETHADKYYLSKDKYNKRELRKESKHRHRLQQEDGTRSHYHSKRRRDENSKKDFTSKKRTKNLMVEDYHGTPRRAFGEAAIPLKSSRIASRNPKAYAVYNSVEDVDGFTGTASNNNSKVDELGGYGGPQSLGFNSGEAGLASNSLFPKQVTTKAAHKVAPVLISRSEREGSNGNHRLADNISHQETHFVRRELEGAARNKFVAIKNDTSASGDVSKLKDQFSFGGHTDGKGSLLGYSHSTPADPKEASQRMRLNVRVSTKDQVEEFTTEEFSPSPVNEKTSQIFRRKNRDELHGEVARGADDASKVEVSGGSAKQDVGSMPHSRKDKDKDTTDACKAQMLPSAMTGAEVNRHHSPGSGVATERQLHSDSLGANDADDGERRASADSITTLPGLIEEILNEKGPNVSYDYICEEVLPHWSKLRKHNGERYAYTSHRQAVLDCLRNRSAWSHLIDRGPKTNLGRKRRRLESAVATESDHAEQLSHFQDGGEDHVPGKASKEAEIDGSESWPLSDSNKEADLSLPEEVPKGKRKARRGRRLTTQSKGYGARAHNGKGERVDESAQGVEDDLDHMVSPFSEEPASSSEDDEIFVHRGPGRHISRHRGSSVDSEDDDIDL